MLVEDLLPDGERTVVITLDPGPKCAGVRLLTRVRSADKAVGGLESGHGRRDIRLFEGEHHQVALHDMCEGKIRIGRKRRLQMGTDVRAIAEVAQDRGVEGLGCRGTRGRERQAVQVSVGHGASWRRRSSSTEGKAAGRRGQLFDAGLPWQSAGAQPSGKLDSLLRVLPGFSLNSNKGIFVLQINGVIT